MTAAEEALTGRQALEIAALFLKERFGDADFAFVAGSIMRGTATPSSDIDLVVIYSSLPHAHRESFVFGGVPVETFVHDEGTLRWFMDADVRGGRPALISMVAEGTAVGPRTERAPSLQDEARILLAKGPAPLDRVTLDRMRYDITDKLDDLRNDRPDFEKVAIGAALYIALADFILRSNGAWTGTSKWLPRKLMEFDAALGQDFAAAFNVLFREGNPGPAIEIAERVLVPHGGLLFDGYRNDAPAEWRQG